MILAGAIAKTVGVILAFVLIVGVLVGLAFPRRR